MDEQLVNFKLIRFGLFYGILNLKGYKKKQIPYIYVYIRYIWVVSK